MVEYACKVFIGGVLGLTTFVATVNAIVSAETRAFSTAFVAVALVCSAVLDSDPKRSMYD